MNLDLTTRGEDQVNIEYGQLNDHAVCMGVVAHVRFLLYAEVC